MKSNSSLPFCQCTNIIRQANSGKLLSLILWRRKHFVAFPDPGDAASAGPEHCHLSLHCCIVWTRASPEPPLDSQCSKDAIICHAHLRFPLPKSGIIYFLAALALPALLSMGEWVSPAIPATSDSLWYSKPMSSPMTDHMTDAMTDNCVMWTDNVFQCLPMYSRQLSGWLCHCNRSTYFSWISLWMDDPTRVGQFSSRSTDLFQVKILFVVWGLPAQ